jgi:hypothetical protein
VRASGGRAPVLGNEPGPGHHLAHRAQAGAVPAARTMNTTQIPPMPQWYSGIKFRSTLEARWAVFFDAAEIRWDYEPEGYVVGGKPYRPDFLLRDCATWVEVKGDPARLDLDLMHKAAVELPCLTPKHEHGPRLMLLGTVPPPPPDPNLGDWGFVSLSPSYPRADPEEGDDDVAATYHGFGLYHKNLRPWFFDHVHPLATGMSLAIGKQAEFALEPFLHVEEWCPEKVRDAYATARAHRFGRR